MRRPHSVTAAIIVFAIFSVSPVLMVLVSVQGQQIDAVALFLTAAVGGIPNVLALIGLVRRKKWGRFLSIALLACYILGSVAVASIPILEETRQVAEVLPVLPPALLLAWLLVCVAFRRPAREYFETSTSSFNAPVQSYQTQETTGTEVNEYMQIVTETGTTARPYNGGATMSSIEERGDVTQRQRDDTAQMNTPVKDADTFGARIFAWALIVGYIGYIVGAGYGGYTEASSIGSGIIWIILMGIAPFIFIPVISVYGFGIVLLAIGLISIGSGGKPSHFITEIISASAVRFAFIGAVISVFVGSCLGVVIEGLKKIWK